MNWAPTPNVMIAGTPKQAIQSANRALVQSAVVMEERGIASGHLAVLSITVKRYVWLLEEGSSPTKSTCMSEVVIVLLQRSACDDVVVQ